MEIFEQDDRKTFFADLLLPVPIQRLFTYRVPVNLNDKIIVGQRAIVQFGDRKIMTGIVVAVHTEAPRDYEAKYIMELLDEIPSVNGVQLRLFEWIASYYVCTLGEVMNAALPSGLKLSSESMVQLNPRFDPDETEMDFSEKEWMVIRRLQQESLSYSEISRLLGVRHIHAILKSLARKDAIILFEEVREKYSPKTEKRIRLAPAYADTVELEKVFSSLATRPKQEDVLMRYLQLVPVLNDGTANRRGISMQELRNTDLSESSINTLIKNGILEQFEVIVPRFGFDEVTGPEITLSAEQARAQDAIFESFERNQVTLLHGITGSGKTEIYVNLVRKAIDSGAQALYLLPEIALTTQMVSRMKRIFGSSLGVYHSRFSDNERVEVWNGILSGRLKFVIGVRSSVFLPFDNLGLVIVDEEHDPSYKQQEPSPRYHARDVAIMLGQFHNAKVLLGSATPSVESFYNCQQGRFGLVSLSKRFGDAQLPSVALADMRSERKRKTIKGEFSSVLLQHIRQALDNNEQVIIFQNRRGYSPMVSCEDCGWVPRCVNCAVSLTYHQFRNAMVCHYCGYREPLPDECPTCTSTRIHTVGYGTEKIVEDLSLYFPEAVVGRMDLDTTRSKTGYETIIEQFEKGETDILVGTQMVTKGLDFDRVSLVGVFNADRMMHFPDFRSYERAYQLITQVSGRAGRRDKPGTVVIQTSNPSHPVLQYILGNRHADFYSSEIHDRKLHGYPPFTRLIEVTLKHTDKKTCRSAAQSLADELRRHLKSVKVLGPGEPMVSKIRNQYLMSTLIKVPRGYGELALIKSAILTHSEALLREKPFRNTRVIIDVDPV